MVRGIYTGASAMMAKTQEMDIVANNLANVDKTAFKKQTAVFKAFPEMLLARMQDDGLVVLPIGASDDPATIGRLGTGVEVNEVFTQFEQGALKKSESHFDFALNGKGFFVIETPDGLRYTRNGNFTRNAEGYLVTHNGDYVLGTQGRVKAQDFNFFVDKEGRVYRNADMTDTPEKMVGRLENRWENRVVYNQLRMAHFENPRELKKMGDSYFAQSAFSGEARPLPFFEESQNTKVLQKFLESSNVKLVDEMVSMISLQRTYEANQKSVRTHDETLGKLVNDVARV